MTVFKNIKWFCKVAITIFFTCLLFLENTSKKLPLSNFKIVTWNSCQKQSLKIEYKYFSIRFFYLNVLLVFLSILMSFHPLLYWRILEELEFRKLDWIIFIKATANVIVAELQPTALLYFIMHLIGKKTKKTSKK